VTKSFLKNNLKIGKYYFLFLKIIGQSVKVYIATIKKQNKTLCRSLQKKKNSLQVHIISTLYEQSRYDIIARKFLFGSLKNISLKFCHFSKSLHQDVGNISP
jgi:hypothetical protein